MIPNWPKRAEERRKKKSKIHNWTCAEHWRQQHSDSPVLGSSCVEVVIILDWWWWWWRWWWCNNDDVDSGAGKDHIYNGSNAGADDKLTVHTVQTTQQGPSRVPWHSFGIFPSPARLSQERRLCLDWRKSFWFVYVLFIVSLHEHLKLVWCFCSMMKKWKLNLPFFPFVFSPFALFTEGERIVETRQKAIETVEQLIARVHLNQAVNRGPIPQTRTLTSWHLQPFAT